ncbi:hypothetical protein D9M68_682320 [compost metagenome]
MGRVSGHYRLRRIKFGIAHRDDRRHQRHINPGQFRRRRPGLPRADRLDLYQVSNAIAEITITQRRLGISQPLIRGEVRGDPLPDLVAQRLHAPQIPREPLTFLAAHGTILHQTTREFRTHAPRVFAQHCGKIPRHRMLGRHRCATLHRSNQAVGGGQHLVNDGEHVGHGRLHAAALGQRTRQQLVDAPACSLQSAASRLKVRPGRAAVQAVRAPQQ